MFRWLAGKVVDRCDGAKWLQDVTYSGDLGWHPTLEKVQVGIRWFTTILIVLFALLKVTGVVGWSWVWVFSPMWIGLLLAFTVGWVAVPRLNIWLHKHYPMWVNGEMRS
jgi:hypothetical protein